MKYTGMVETDVGPMFAYFSSTYMLIMPALDNQDLKVAIEYKQPGDGQAVVRCSFPRLQEAMVSDLDLLLGALRYARQEAARHNRYMAYCHSHNLHVFSTERIADGLFNGVMIQSV